MLHYQIEKKVKMSSNYTNYSGRNIQQLGVSKNWYNDSM